MTTLDKITALALEKCRTVKACHDPKFVAVDCGEAPDTNERMRLTSDGALLIIDEGRYWQVDTLEQVYSWLESLPMPMKEKNT